MYLCVCVCVFSCVCKSKSIVDNFAKVVDSPPVVLGNLTFKQYIFFNFGIN